MSVFFQLSVVVLLTFHSCVFAGKIVGGREASPHSRPYMVFLESTNYTCGGFLLNKNFVMTAAHCQKFSKVHLGLHNVKDRKHAQSIEVKSSFPHPNYTDLLFTNDLMILQLNSPVELNDYVKPIALPKGDNGSLPKFCSTSGWGALDRNNFSLPLKLMEVGVSLTESKDCSNKKVYCAKGEAGPGLGDSGGPLVCGDQVAYGVVSTYYNYLNVPVCLYAKIPDFKTWIDSIISKASSKV